MQYSVVILETGMTTEINKKRGRPSECREEAQAKAASEVRTAGGLDGGAYSTRGIFEVYNCQKCKFLAGNARHSRQIDIWF